MEMLAALAEKLGQSVVTLWPHAMRYLVADAIANIVFGVILIVATVFGVKKVWKLAEDLRDDGLIRGAVVACAVLVGLIGLNIIFNSIPTLVDPEGSAAVSLLKKAGK